MPPKKGKGKPKTKAKSAARVSQTVVVNVTKARSGKAGSKGPTSAAAAGFRPFAFQPQPLPNINVSLVAPPAAAPPPPASVVTPVDVQRALEAPRGALPIGPDVRAYANGLFSQVVSPGSYGTSMSGDTTFVPRALDSTPGSPNAGPSPAPSLKSEPPREAPPAPKNKASQGAVRILSYLPDEVETVRGVGTPLSWSQFKSLPEKSPKKEEAKWEIQQIARENGIPHQKRITEAYYNKVMASAQSYISLKERELQQHYKNRHSKK